MTLADLQHLPYGTALVAVGVGNVFEKRPNVKRYGIREIVIQLVLIWCLILGGGTISSTDLLGRLSRTGLKLR